MLSLGTAQLELTAKMDESDAQIKIDLKDSVIKEALSTGVDLRQYSQQVEQQLKQVGLPLIISNS